MNVDSTPTTPDAMDLSATLKALPELLALRERELDARESAIARAEAELERLRSLVVGDASGSDVLHLNVGGELCCTLRSTLCCVPHSMLASKFSGRWDDALEKDRDGNFFVDQPMELFRPMLNHM